MHIDLPLRIRITTALIGIVLIGAIATVLVHYGLGTFDPGYRLVVSFDTAGHGLDSSSPVKIRGVTVGAVDDVVARPDGRAEVTLKLQPVIEVADTATAAIEALSVFGPKYIRIDQGEHEATGPFLAEGDTLAGTEQVAEFTAVIQKAGELFEVINPDDIATIVSTFADSVAGLGDEFGRMLDNGALLIDVGVRHLPELQQFLNDVSLLTTAFAEQTSYVATINRNLYRALPPIAARTNELGGFLDQGSQVSSKLSGYIGGRLESFGLFVESAADLLAFFNRTVQNFPNLIRLLDQVVADIGNAVHLEVGSPSQPTELVGALYGPGCAVVKMNFLPSPLPGIPLPMECPETIPGGG